MARVQELADSGLSSVPFGRVLTPRTQVFKRGLKITAPTTAISPRAISGVSLIRLVRGLRHHPLGQTTTN